MPNLLFLAAALALGRLLWLAMGRLAVAGPPDRLRTPAARAVAATGGAVGAALALGWLFASPWLAIVALAAAPWVPRVRGGMARRRHQQALTEQMPDFLEGLAAALRAGASLPQALEGAVEDLRAPARDAALRLLRGLRLGGLPEDLLAEEARACEGHALAADWRLASTAVGIQRQSGGDLAGILDQLCETLRERQRLRAQVDALTAQGRLSAWVVGLLPLALLAALQALDPDLLHPLFHTGAGWALLGLAAVLEAAGVLLLRRIVDINP